MRDAGGVKRWHGLHHHQLLLQAVRRLSGGFCAACDPGLTEQSKQIDSMKRRRSDHTHSEWA